MLLTQTERICARGVKDLLCNPRYIIAARIMAHFGGDLAKAKAYAMLSLGEACRYLNYHW